MKVLAALILLLLMFQQLPLSSREAFNTDAFDCSPDKTWHEMKWSGGLSIIRKGQLWLGMNSGTVADFGFAVERDRDHTFLFRGNWDHYAEPSGISDQYVDMDFAPDYILLLPGEKLTLYYYCQTFGGSGAGQAIVNLWSFP
jgi:hypothetical protein